MYSHPDNAFPVEEGVVGGFVLFVRLSCYSIINTSSFSLFCHYICFVRGPWRRQISRALEWLHSPDIHLFMLQLTKAIVKYFAIYCELR